MDAEGAERLLGREWAVHDGGGLLEGVGGPHAGAAEDVEEGDGGPDVHTATERGVEEEFKGEHGIDGGDDWWDGAGECTLGSRPWRVVGRG